MNKILNCSRLVKPVIVIGTVGQATQWVYHGSEIKLLEKCRDPDDLQLKEIGVKEELMGELKKWNIDGSVLCKTRGTLMCLSIGTPESNKFSMENSLFSGVPKLR